MARLYQVSESEGGCPGETNCETWQSSASDVEIRCPSCPKRQAAIGNESTDENTEKPESLEETQLLDAVERFRRERSSGRAVYELTTPIEWEAMLIWDETVEQYRRGHEIRIEQMFQLMTATMTRT